MHSTVKYIYFFLSLLHWEGHIFFIYFFVGGGGGGGGWLSSSGELYVWFLDKLSVGINVVIRLRIAHHTDAKCD